MNRMRPRNDSQKETICVTYEQSPCCHNKTLRSKSTLHVLALLLSLRNVLLDEYVPHSLRSLGTQKERVALCDCTGTKFFEPRLLV